MNNNWQTKRLGDISTLVKGKKPKLFTKANGKPYLTARVVRETEAPELVDGDCPVSVWVKPKDIVIIMDGSNSGEMFSGLDGALASTMGAIKFDEQLLEARYLYSFLVTHRENFTKSRTGAAIPHLNKEGFENLEIPIPSLAEQKRIVKILDEVFEKIAKAKENTEKNLKNSKELFESYLQNVFENPEKDWKETTLGSEVELISGFAFKSTGYTNNLDDIKLLRGDNILPQTLRWDDVKKWPAQDVLNYQDYQLDQGDIVLAMDRPWIKAGLKHAMIQKSDLPCLLVQRVARIRPKENLNNKYLMHIIQSTNFIKHILGVQGGLGVPHISGSQIKNFTFTIPPIKDQITIVKKLDSLSEQTKKLEANYKQKIADLDELKKSLLTKAFAGEL